MTYTVWFGWRYPDAPQTTDGRGGWSAHTASHEGKRFVHERSALRFARQQANHYQSVELEYPDGGRVTIPPRPIQWWEFWR